MIQSSNHNKIDPKYIAGNTYRSPNDPDAILFSNFNSRGSISQTSLPSVGISTWSGTDTTPVWTWSLISGNEWSFNQGCFCSALQSTINKPVFHRELNNSNDNNNNIAPCGCFIWSWNWNVILFILRDNNRSVKFSTGN